MGGFLRTLPADERILVIAAGGISHAPLSLIPWANKFSEAERVALVAYDRATAAEAINPSLDE